MLKDYLAEPDCRGIVRTTDGKLIRFRHSGVADLLQMVTTQTQLLNGSDVADRVIGKGAALLLLVGKVSSVYAQVISSGALKALREGGVKVSFGIETPYIKNRKGDGMCPVERLLAETNNPTEAVKIIKIFVENINNKQ